MTEIETSTIIGNFLSSIFSNLVLTSLLLFLISFLIVVFTIPKIIFVAFSKRLITPIVSRSSHTSFTPAFGGVAIYLSIILSSIAIQLHTQNDFGYAISAAITFIFIVGLKDDLVNSRAKSKLLGEIVAVLLISFHPLMIVNNFHGFLGIYQISSIITVPLVLIFFIIIINSYNLIDGIDGLAGSIGILISCIFAFYFIATKDYYFFMLALILVGSLLGFLFFNLQKTNKKIFMGDCGSLVVGLLIGIFSIRFLNSTNEHTQFNFILPENKLPALFFILFTPIFDTIRVVIIRILKGKSPFEADRNHLHHVFVTKGLSHKKSTFIISVLHILIIGLMLSISKWFHSVFTFFLLVLVYSCVAFIIYVYRRKKQFEFKKIN